jgi:hypothetical protein
MRKTLLIFGGIALLCFLLVVRLIFKQKNSFEDEREWFAKELRYEFSARVDSVQMYNESSCKLWCRITSGDPQVDREDSLKRSFEEHDMLYLIFYRSDDSITFLHPNSKLVAKGDSVRISSEKNTIQFFRDKKQIVNDQLSEVLTGFGKPFFLKKKKK